MENKDKYTYFLIILLGVLAFFLSTFFFSRVRSAEAATESSANSSKVTSDLPSLSDFREVFAANGYDVDLDANNSVVFFASGSGVYQLFYLPDSSYYLTTYSFTHSYELHMGSFSCVTFNISSGEFKFVSSSSSSVSSFSYYDAQNGYVWGKLPSKNEYYVKPVLSYPGKASIHFDPNAPYLDIDKLFYENKIYTNPGTRDTDSSFYKFRFKLFGDFSESSVAKMKFTVRLPSDSFFQEFLNEALLDVESNNDVLARKDRLLAWRKRKVSIETNFVFEFDYDWSFKHLIYNTDTGTILLSFTFEDILEKIEEKYGSLNELYGFSGSQKDIEKQRAELAMYLTVQRVGSVVYNFESKVYGPYTTIDFLLGNPYAPASTVVAEDYLADGFDIGSVVDDNIQNIFKDKYEALIKDREELQQYIDSMNELQGAFDGNLKATSLWTSFKSTVTGLFSLITILPQISYIVGLAFGFLPLPVSSLILSVFLVVLIAAIIRAIRG